MEIYSPPVVLHPGYPAGRWIQPFNSGSLGAGTALSSTAIRLLPFYVPVTTKIDRIGLRITTLSAAGNVRCGIYRHDAASGVPGGAPVVDSGSMSTGSTGLVEATVSATLEPGWYWMGVIADNTTVVLQTCLGSEPVLASFIGTATDSISNDAAGTSRAVAQYTATYGALPTITPGSVTFGTTQGTGMIRMRTA